MGDFNPNSPTLRGMEWRPSYWREFLMDSSTKALAMRFKSGGAVTVTAIDYFLSKIVDTPGLGIEVLSTLVPTDRQVLTVTPTRNGPMSNMQNQAAGASTFAQVDDMGDYTDYWRNTTPRIGIPATYGLVGGGVAALAGRRIESVTIKAIIKAQNADCAINATITDGAGIPVVIGGNKTIPGDDTWRVYELWDSSVWKYTDAVAATAGSGTQPWSMANVNLLITAAGSRTFGIYSSNCPGLLYVASLWLEVAHVAENRIGQYYNWPVAVSGPPVWGEATLSSTAAMAANTWYYLVMWALGGSSVFVGANRYFSVPILGAKTPRVAEAAAATDTTKEHRKLYELAITPSGVAQSISKSIYGEMLPVLLDRGGVIESQSQPYTIFGQRGGSVTNQVNSSGDPLINASSTGLFGTEVTSAAGATLYTYVAAVVGWEDPAQRPDGPLTIEIRRGAGSMTGGGTLDATAVLQPTDLATGEFQDVYIPIAAGAGFTTQAGATQYFLRLLSTATSGKGWKVGRITDLPIGASLFAGGPTQAELDGATQGGTADSYFFNNAEDDKQELAMAFAVPPTAPSNFSATPVSQTPPNNVLTPPRVELSWTATALGTAFKAYRVYRRAARSAAAAWELIAEITVPTGYTAATVEAQHNRFTDYEAGWKVTNGQWADGWDYAVSVVNATTGLESAKSTADTLNVVSADSIWWLCSNAAPFLRFPIQSAMEVSVADRAVVQTYRAAGRDEVLTRTPAELPERVASVNARYFDRVGEDPLRMWRAAAASGRAVALLGPRGDRWIGALEAPSNVDHGLIGILDVQTQLIESARYSALADYNLPAGLVTNGTTSYISHPDTGNLLDPGAGAFSIVLAAAFTNIANTVALSKGDTDAAQSYGIECATAGALRMIVRGAAGAVGTEEFSASWFDGSVHVAIGTSSGTAQKLYRDGAQVAATATTHGAVANAVNFIVGADNGGGSEFMALSPVRAYAFYQRELSPDEAQAAAYCLLGYPGYRMPAGAVLFVDLRDRRCWSGVGTSLVNLADDPRINGTINGAVTRGIPWVMSDVERF